MAGLDGTGEVVLLPKLVKRLTEAGIDKKYFQPVLSKRKKVMGYILVSENILGRVLDLFMEDPSGNIGEIKISGTMWKRKEMKR